MPWAFRNRRAEDLVSLCYKFSAKLLVISRTTQSISGTSLIWRHNNKSSWRNNASLGWGMTTFVYVWLSSVICGTVVPRRWTHSATTPPYSNLISDCCCELTEMALNVVSKILQMIFLIISCYLKFDSCPNITAIKMPVKFQSNQSIPITTCKT